jgi:hypothetical protein
MKPTDERDKLRLEAFERHWEWRRWRARRIRQIVDGLTLICAVALGIAALGIVAGWW